MRASRSAISCLVLTVTLSAAQGQPAFDKKPTAVRSGDKTTIDFSVNRATDVAVTIEDSKGRIVRHLAAGVLGKNPPEPCRRGRWRNPCGGTARTISASRQVAALSGPACDSA